MKKRFMTVAMLLGLAAATWGMSDDVWKSKPYTEWTDADIQKVIAMSPWVKTASVEATWKPVQQVNAASGQMTNSGGGMSTAGGGKQSGGTSTILPAEAERDAGTKGPQVAFNVYWMSSQTMRAALARRSVLHNGKDPAEAQKYVEAPMDDYEIMVQGADMAPFYRQEEKYYETNAALEIKKTKQKVMPSRVVYGKDPNGNINSAMFFFPKKVNGQDWLSTSDKNVEFTCKLGVSTLHAVFEPAKMENQKGPDL